MTVYSDLICYARKSSQLSTERIWDHVGSLGLLLILEGYLGEAVELWSALYKHDIQRTTAEWGDSFISSVTYVNNLADLSKGNPLPKVLKKSLKFSLSGDAIPVQIRVRLYEESIWAGLLIEKYSSTITIDDNPKLHRLQNSTRWLRDARKQGKISLEVYQAALSEILLVFEGIDEFAGWTFQESSVVAMICALRVGKPEVCAELIEKVRRGLTNEREPSILFTLFGFTEIVSFIKTHPLKQIDSDQAQEIKLTTLDAINTYTALASKRTPTIEVDSCQFYLEPAELKFGNYWESQDDIKQGYSSIGFGDHLALLTPVDAQELEICIELRLDNQYLPNIHDAHMVISAPIIVRKNPEIFIRTLTQMNSDISIKIPLGNYKILAAYFKIADEFDEKQRVILYFLPSDGVFGILKADNRE